jgi:hypothetical protein
VSRPKTSELNQTILIFLRLELSKFFLVLTFMGTQLGLLAVQDIVSACAFSACVFPFNNDAIKFIKSTDTLYFKSEPSRLSVQELKSRKIFTKEFTVLLCLVSLMISIGQGQIIGNKTLTSSGRINYSSPNAQLLFKPDFDLLTAPIDLGSDYAYYEKSDFVANQIVIWYPTTGSYAAVESGTNVQPHTGTKCMALVSGTSGAVRAEWQLTHLDGTAGWGTPDRGVNGLNIGDDYYVSVWLYFPEDWSLPMPSGDYGYWELMNPFWFTVNGPRTCVHIHHLTDGNYNLVLHFQRNNGDYTGRTYKGNSETYMQWTLSEPFDLSRIRGKWTKWAYYVHRSTNPDEVVMTFWLDGELLKNCTRANNESSASDTSGLTSKAPTGAHWWSTFAKNYMVSDGDHHYLYVDDLEVWDGIP